ncbi:cytidine deaminase [Aeromicrobium sp. CF3.5]|uniref:cytidine deaminase n=1 Tax=Aeromicrobium sp. CF3.5 TaxID=3373078 RepID=UPI003EE4F931
MQLDPEDVKLVTLARASRARAAAEQGAAVRDQDGRTYAASTVALASLRIDALDLAVAMAVSSGARSLEAAAVVGGAEPSIDAVRDLAGDGIDIVLADDDGTPASVLST